MSVRRILATREEKGPFAGIVCFSSGAAIAFIIPEEAYCNNLYGISLMVRMNPTAAIGYGSSDSADGTYTFEVCPVSQRLQARK